MKIESLNRLIVNVLRSNVPDPLNRGITWITYGYTQDTIRYPSIAVFQSSARGDILAIGDKTNVVEVLYLIEIVTNKDAEATINGSRYSGYKLTSYLTDAVTKAIMNQRNYARTQGIEDWNIVRIETMGYDPDREEYKQRVWLSCIGVLEAT